MVRTPRPRHADAAALGHRHRVHVIRMRWGKVVEIDANEDSQAVARGLAAQAVSDIAEAEAGPIES